MGLDVAHQTPASWEEWNFPDDMKVTVVKKGSQISDVLYNGKPLPPHARDSLKIEESEGTYAVTLTFIAFDLETEEAE